MTAHPEAFKRLASHIYTIANYPEKTPQEARQHIRTLLEDTNFMVNVSPVTLNQLVEISGSMSELPPTVSAAAVETGMIWVHCYVDGTANTGTIEHGQPVCFDTVTGRAVTGVNEDWGKSEYKIVGTAWKSFTGPGYDRIPITLAPSIPGTDAAPISLRRVQLSTSLSLGGSANGFVVEWDGLNWSTTGEAVEVFDSLNRFTGEPGDRFWFAQPEDSEMNELVSPNKNMENLRRVQLNASLSLGGSATGWVVEWNGLNWAVTAEVVEVFDSLVRFTGVPGDRFWFTKPLLSAKNEIISPTKPGNSTLPIRFRLKTNLALGGLATADRLIWDNVAGIYEATTEVQVREFVGPPHFTAGIGADGWAILMDDREDAYEILWMEMQARFVRSHGNGDINQGTGALAIVQDYFWMGYNPALAQVWDEDDFFPQVMAPMSGIRATPRVLSIYDEQLNKHRILQSHSKAGWIIFESNAPFAEVTDVGDPDIGLVRAICVVKHFGGTQQDVQNPADSLGFPVVFVYDMSDELEGKSITSLAVLNATEGRYYACPNSTPGFVPPIYTTFTYPGTGFGLPASAFRIPLDPHVTGSNGITLDSVNEEIVILTDGAYWINADLRFQSGATGLSGTAIGPRANVRLFRVRAGSPSLKAQDFGFLSWIGGTALDVKFNINGGEECIAGDSFYFDFTCPTMGDDNFESLHMTGLCTRLS